MDRAGCSFFAGTVFYLYVTCNNFPNWQHNCRFPVSKEFFSEPALRRALRIILKTVLWTLISVVLLLLLITAVIRVPYVQTYLVKKVTEFVSSRTNTEVRIGFVGINFPQSLALEGLYAEDLTHDTLVRIGSLKADIDMLALFRSTLSVRKLTLEDATVKLKKTLPDSTFNFQFLIDAFASGKEEQEPADTASGGFKIRADELELREISFLFDDSASGIRFSARSGLLHISLDEMDLDSMLFDADEITIENTHASFAIYRRSAAPGEPLPDDTIPAQLPYLDAGHIRLTQSSFVFENHPDTSAFSFSVANLEASPERIDLNRELIDIKDLLIEKPIALMMMRKSGTAESEAAGEDQPDTSAGWQVKAGRARINGGYFKMDVTNVPRAAAGMDYSHLLGRNIQVDLQDAFYSSRLIKGYLKHASLSEQCGLTLKHLSTRFAYDDRHAELAALRLETDRTRAGSYIGISYPSLASLSTNIGELGVVATLKKTRIHLQDVLYFAPDLISLPPFNGSAEKEITINGKIKGKVNDLLISGLIVTAGEQTAIQADGRMTGLPDPDKAYFDINLETFTSTKSDLMNLVGVRYLPQQIDIPEQLMVRGSYKGSIRNFASNIALESTQGNASLRTELNLAAGKFAADGKIHSLNLGYLLKNPSLGKISATLRSDASNLEQDKLTGSLEATIQSVYFNKYVYRDVSIRAKARNGLVKADAGINDPNLVLSLHADGNLARDSERVDLVADLTGANFKALGLSDEDLRTGARLQASVRGFDPEIMDGYAGIGGLLVATPDYRYKFDSITVVTVNDPGKHLLELKSPVLTARYEGSLALNKIAPALNEHLNYYLKSDSKLPDTTSGTFSFHADVKPHPVFHDLLLKDLQRFSGISIRSDYNSLSRSLTLEVNTPQIVYGAYNFQDLAIKAGSNEASMNYSVTLRSLKNGNINLPLTSVNGVIDNGVIDNTIRIAEQDSGNRLLMRNELTMRDGVTTISVKDGRIVLDNREWRVPSDNLITIAPAGINIRNLEVTNLENSIDVQSKSSEPGAPIDISFRDFNLGELAQVIENDTQLVRGNLNGELHITRMTPFAFTSNLRISGVLVKEIPVGDVTIEADNQSANRYTARVGLKGNDNSLQIKGYYENEQLNLDADIARITLKTVEAFAPSQLNNASGYLTGSMRIRGKASKPAISGKITFKDAQFTLVAINNRISMNNESISLNETGIHFSRFTVLDQSNQPLVLNGDIFTTDLMKMRFNLDVKSNRFTVLNSTARNNKLYYGRIIVNSQIRIRGTQDLPVVDADIRLIEGSNLTYVVQKGDLSTDIGEDIVQVINKDTNVFFQFTDTTLTGTSFRGIELTANIEIDRRTVFTIVVDKSSGDRLIVAGDALLNFGLDQSGKISLTGTYVLNSGSYKTTIQNVASKEFLIKSGSRITWTGDPTLARVDVTAIYKARTGSADLMAADVTPEERNRYRKILEYHVYLMVKGDLTDPELSFSINLAEKDRGAFGGVIESKLMTINNDPNELNKQVLALLVANTFLPPSNMAAAGGGGTSAVARNSVNQLLADQLTAFGSKLVKGGELKVDIETNDDYGASGGVDQQNTQYGIDYRQNLFNERLTVQVGGNVNVNDNSPQATSQQNITGDVVVEYKITEDGRYRFKAFRENNYEGLIDGMLYKTGVGIMYNREYDNLKELFSPPKNEDGVTIPETKKKKKKNRKKEDKPE